MVADFKHRHRGGEVPFEQIRALQRICPMVAGAYERYSCSHSTPNSIVDQLMNSLDRACEEGRFVPWEYVFADYSVTGMDASRQGYRSYKKLLSHKDHLIETTYIDDFTRASRDELEWWRLAHLSRRLSKRMIGAADGFDLSAPNWDIMITVYGLLSRLFLKGTREKVKRGMKGAAGRGDLLGRVSLGFTRRIRLDDSDNPVHDRDGSPIHDRCVDPATKDFLLLAYELYVRQCWSINRIAKHFNELKVDGGDTWSQGTIRKLLWGPAGIGVFIWNRTRREHNRESEKWEVHSNPRSEWVVRYDRNLAIVPMDLWRAARRKLAATRRAHPRTGRRSSCNESASTTLFSGTLVCGYCGHVLRLDRSADRYKQMCCLNGRNGCNGCTLNTSKSVTIIEDRLLEYLRDVLLTAPPMDALVARANAFVEEEARRPQINTTPMRTKIRSLEAKMQKLFDRIEDGASDELSAAYDSRIRELQRQLQAQRAAVSAAERQNRVHVKPIDPLWAQATLADMRALLNQEIPMAAEAIRTLTGPITVRQEERADKPGVRWIASFAPDLTALVRKIAKENGAPERAVLATMPPAADTVDVVVDQVPKYEQLAPKFKELHQQGMSVDEIAAAYGMSRQYARGILEFALTGRRPAWVAAKSAASRAPKVP
jgi:DNA invertase Pin-like site-specific DNA recombinase